MFNLLLNMFRRWAFARRRNIYRFFDGQRMRSVDPLRLYREILMHEDYRADDWSMSRVDNRAVKLAAIARLASVWRFVTDTDTAEDGGLSDAECYSLIGEFVQYSEEQKKSTVQTPISLQLLELRRCRPLLTSMHGDSVCISTFPEFDDVPGVVSLSVFQPPSTA